MEFATLLPEKSHENSFISEQWKHLFQNFKNYVVAEPTRKSDENTDIMSSLSLSVSKESLQYVTEALTPFNITINVFDSMLSQVETIFLPYVLLLFERHKLSNYKRREHDSVMQFVTDLRRQIDICELGEKKETIFREFFIGGMKDEEYIQYWEHLSRLKQECMTMEGICDEISTWSHHGSGITDVLKNELEYEHANSDSELKSNCETQSISSTLRKVKMSRNKNKITHCMKNTYDRCVGVKKQKKFDKSSLKLSSIPGQTFSKTDVSSICNANSTQDELKLKTSLTSNFENPCEKPEILVKTQEEPNLKCQHCGKWFRTPSLMSRHLIKHSKEKMFSCFLCSHKLKRKSDLVVHMRKHNGQRNFKCSVCGFAFLRSDHLKVHFRIHTGEKPYKCTACDRSFSRLTSLNVHRQTHCNISDNPYKFMCDKCGKSFRQRTPFTTHLRGHTGERPHPCTDCSKCFTSKSLLNQHQRIHTGELPFICDICGKRFRHNQNLFTHKKLHSGKRSYSCEICGASYRYTKNLKQHMKAIHGIVSNSKKET